MEVFISGIVSVPQREEKLLRNSLPPKVTHLVLGLPGHYTVFVLQLKCVVCIGVFSRVCAVCSMS